MENQLFGKKTFQLRIETERLLRISILNYNSQFLVGAGLLYKWVEEIVNLKLANKPEKDVIASIFEYNLNTPTGHLLEGSEWRRFTREEIESISQSFFNL